MTVKDFALDYRPQQIGARGLAVHADCSQRKTKRRGPSTAATRSST
jgi:hypothetical protein